MFAMLCLCVGDVWSIRNAGQLGLRDTDWIDHSALVYADRQ